jgi:hypothetical protein
VIAEIDALDLVGAEAAGAESRALSAARQWDLAVANGRPHLIGTQDRILGGALDRLYALAKMRAASAPPTGDWVEDFVASLQRPWLKSPASLSAVRDLDPEE